MQDGRDKEDRTMALKPSHSSRLSCSQTSVRMTYGAESPEDVRGDFFGKSKLITGKTRKK